MGDGGGVEGEGGGGGEVEGQRDEEGEEREQREGEQPQLLQPQVQEGVPAAQPLHARQRHRGDGEPPVVHRAEAQGVGRSHALGGGRGIGGVRQISVILIGAVVVMRGRMI